MSLYFSVTKNHQHYCCYHRQHHVVVVTIVLIMVTIVLVRRGRSVSGQTEQEDWRDGLMAKGADIALVTYTR